MGTDGMKMQGTNGSQLWDTAFAVQVLLASGRAVGMSGDVKESLKSAGSWLRDTQIEDNPPGFARFYRQANKGTREQLCSPETIVRLCGHSSPDAELGRWLCFVRAQEGRSFPRGE